MKILFASRNERKAGELAVLLPGVDLSLWSGPDIPEDGAFFQDNALQKAIFARNWHTREGCFDMDGFLADDSGLCVDALFGGPGVLSARFAPHLDYPEKNKLLLNMVNLGEPRSARFVCVLAFVASVSPDLAQFTVSGRVEGTLAHEPRGYNGFGYDPIFIPNGHDLTFGELAPEVKNELSHRGNAARALAMKLGL